MKPTAGMLNRRILIQSLTHGKDAEGGMVDTWVDVTTVWAKVANLSGAERNATSHGGKAPGARTEFTIRYTPGITAQHRVVYATKQYNIRHVNNFAEANEFLVLTCDTGINHGR